MRNDVSRQVRLEARPSGIPRAGRFELVEAAVPEPANGQVLVRNLYLSVEPAMRGWVSAVANYSEPVPLGAVTRSIAPAGSCSRAIPAIALVSSRSGCSAGRTARRSGRVRSSTRWKTATCRCRRRSACWA